MTRALLIAVILVAASAAPARAADLVVNSNADPVSGDGVCTPEPGGCTLRDALTDAGSADNVQIRADTYTLTQGPLTVGGTTIVGAGARTTILEGDGIARIVRFTGGISTVSGLTLRNGGGQDTLGGVEGGAISVEGADTELTLIDSTVTANHAEGGGGILSNNATLTLVGTTVSGNQALVNPTSPTPLVGGGILVVNGVATLRNTTVSGNSATSGSIGQGGGVHVQAGELHTENATIAGNSSPAGAGVWSNGTADLSHTIVAGNPLPTGGTQDCGGTLPVGDHNIAGDGTCGFAGSPRNPLLLPLANNGGPTDTRALAAGSPAINAGTSCPVSDQRGVARQGACDIGAYEFVPAAAPPPPPPPQGNQQLPPPVVGKLVNAEPLSGTVKIKVPGSSEFVVLAEGEQIPVGTTVDTRKGRVSLTAAANRSGGTAKAKFYDGLFKLGQTKGKRPITTLTLVEKLTGCTTKGKASAAAKKKKKRRLWGDGKGKFRTKGRNSAATVLGTKWLVEDRCTSTLTKVARGKVSVRDFVKKKTVTVKKGKRYIARAKP